MDNYGTHGHADVKSWLEKHPRFVIHYVPTSCSWLNLIERWFGELTSKRIRRDSFFTPAAPDPNVSSGTGVELVTDGAVGVSPRERPSTCRRMERGR